MSSEPPGGRSGQPLAWVGLGVGVIGVAFALRPRTQASGAVFWIVLGVGILAILVGGAIIVFGRTGSSPARQGGKKRRRLVAVECDRFSDALSTFISEQWRLRPRSLPFGNGITRQERWQEEAEARYRKNFRPWGLETFDEAARLDGVASSSRVFVETPSIEQLQQLPDLFRDAARSLERG